MTTVRDSRVKADLWYWLVDGDVPRNEIGKKPSKFLLDLYKQKCSTSNEQKPNLNHRNRESHPLNQLLDLNQFTRPEPFK